MALLNSFTQSKQFFEIEFLSWNGIAKQFNQSKQFFEIELKQSDMVFLKWHC